MRFLWLRTGVTGKVLEVNRKWYKQGSNKNHTRNWKKWENTRKESKKLIKLNENEWADIYDEGTPLTIAFRKEDTNRIYYGNTGYGFLATRNEKALKKIIKNELKRTNWKIKEKKRFLLSTEKKEAENLNFLIKKRLNLILFFLKAERW